MEKIELQQAILRLLVASTLPDHDKMMVQTLLPVMSGKVLEDIYNSLMTEKDKMTQLQEKKKRIELKYQVMVENLNTAKSDKKEPPSNGA